MNNTLESCKLLRDAAIKNINKYCLSNPETFEEVWNYYCNISDKYNILTPLEYYRNLYNNTLELLINK